MSIQAEIERLNQSKREMAQALEEKGSIIPPNEKIDKYPEYIRKMKIPTKLSELQSDTEHQLVTSQEKQDWNAKLSKAELQPAINSALDQAKDSGAFNGPPGKDGSKITQITITLLRDKWVQNAQIIENVQLKAQGFIYTYGPSYEYIETFIESQVTAEDVLQDGQMTFHCKTQPKSDIIIVLMGVIL